MRIKETEFLEKKMVGEVQELTRVPINTFLALMPPLMAADFHGAVVAATANYRALQNGLVIKEVEDGRSSFWSPTNGLILGGGATMKRVKWEVAKIDGDTLVVYEEVWEGWTRSSR